MKKIILILSILLVGLNVNAQEKAFELKKRGKTEFLVPDFEKNPFEGKKNGLYQPPANLNWWSENINTILSTNFTNEQIKKIADAGIIVHLHANLKGEIKYMEFFFPKRNTNAIPSGDLLILYNKIKEIKVEMQETGFINGKDFDYFTLTIRLKKL